ncbi:CDPK-related protein kinase [Artemisia annua]|uniref:CDPK-related protein kinase n=1 Tax=Artemisia annua TaxID=35608 RepID=A0A2U1QKB6_ARTAN|nr:CDPK-related protein kinase [Artemisia annua]
MTENKMHQVNLLKVHAFQVTFQKIISRKEFLDLLYFAKGFHFFQKPYDASRIADKPIGVADMDETVNRAVVAANHEAIQEACNQSFNLQPGCLIVIVSFDLQESLFSCSCATNRLTISRYQPIFRSAVLWLRANAGHPWIRNTANELKVPLDISILRLMKAYMRSSALRKAALRALSKTLSVDELFYLKEQFSLLEPTKNGSINMETHGYIKSYLFNSQLLNLLKLALQSRSWLLISHECPQALMKHATDAMKESHVYDFLSSLSALQYGRMDFEEFCAAAINIYQLEALDRWEQYARCAYELFEKDGNQAIMIEELASELGLSPSVPVHAIFHDWIRHTDGKLSSLGFVKLLHGVSGRTLANNKPQ